MAAFPAGYSITDKCSMMNKMYKSATQETLRAVPQTMQNEL
jgi:hypothetical protein